MHPALLSSRRRHARAARVLLAATFLTSLSLLGGGTAEASPITLTTQRSGCPVEWTDGLLGREVITNPCSVPTQAAATCRPLLGGPMYVKVGRPIYGAGVLVANCEWFDREESFTVTPGRQVPVPRW